MVRNYVRKSRRGSNYSRATLDAAVDEVRKGTKSLKRAADFYAIPFQTLSDHVKGRHGVKSSSQGRAPAIPLDLEIKLAEGLKTMEKWGFGLSRKEVLEVVGDFVKKNLIKTPFKNGVPGEDWFLAFKKRHNLSIKKPQSVEYARKKMTDPFVVQEYFDLLKTTINELDLEGKPDQIWNLDETSFCLDPTKVKVVGKKGTPSSRTTSGPGRENTTVLAACSAAGNKAPPLIIFKGAKMWDQWVAPEDKAFPGTSYAASGNGWMESQIFSNYFLKTFVPALGNQRPVLLIYDGHSSHVATEVIERAIKENVTILKLPPHTSHLLQPLDLSVFKSMKTTWDEKIVKWQRRNVGLRIPKRDFSSLVGETWSEIAIDVLRNGFRKAGIVPFNNAVIPESKYDPAALIRWKKNCHVTNETEQAGALTQSDSEAVDHSFEDILLLTVKPNVTSQKEKKTRVAHGAEVITAADVLERLNKMEVATNLKKKKRPETDESKPAKRVKLGQRLKRKLTPEELDETEEVAEVVDLEEENEIKRSEQEPISLSEGKWVLVKYSSERRSNSYYVGIVESKNHSIGQLDWNVKFVKYKDGHFIWPELEDEDTISTEDVVKVLPVPTMDRRGNTLTFPVDFEEYNIR